MDAYVCCYGCFLCGHFDRACQCKGRKNASDVAAVKKIIEEQRAQAKQIKGSTSQVNAIMDSLDNLENLDSRRYVWSSQGRLIQMKWSTILLVGDISFAGLPELKGA